MTILGALALAATADLPIVANAKCASCDKDAVFAYRWEWGESGVVCAEHAALLQQAAVPLNRSIVIHPIQQAAPAPIGRDERIQLTARALVLEAELEDAKTRGLDLYRRNGNLQVRLNTAIIQAREKDAQLADARLTVEKARADLSEVDRRNGEMLVELDRLRNLEAFVNDQAAREEHERGLEQQPTVVDG